jgi:lipid II:glycine glycyltransferase (peptidoglycan interpeptide bridge formation enzyme)
MTARFATDQELSTWNDRILQNPDGGNILQSIEYAGIKKLNGWTARYVIVDEYALTIIEKSLPFFGKLWYVSKGPGVATVEQLAAITPQLASLAKQAGAFVVRLDPELLASDVSIDQLNGLGLVKSRNIQANISTITVDLTPGTETVLQEMSQKTRHAIKRAAREGLVVKKVEINEENMSIMYELLTEAMSHVPTIIRSKEYYFNFWRTFDAAGIGHLFIAYDGDTPTAAAYILKYGTKATYKDGGSRKEKTIYGTSQALQWAAMEWCAEQSVTIYDLCGSPPSDKINDPTHPYYGFGRFKTGFNKNVTDYIGTFDLPISQFKNKLWTKYGDKIARRVYSRLTGGLFY